MKIGDLDLGYRPLLLAPMEDVTDISFRVLCREQGADMVYTEFVPSDGLIRDASKAIAKMHTLEEEAPVGIQIYGHLQDSMVEAAKMAANAAEIAGGHGADVIDINFGCPVSKIAGRGAGSGMMREPDKMVAITKAVVEAVPNKPVTVKTRLGWDDNSKIIVELAERLQDVGIKALTIHGRTRCQMYRGQADWSLIGEVKRNPRMYIPIIGNGDIVDGPSAKRAFDDYGVDAIMIARATFGRPWIFREIKEYLAAADGKGLSDSFRYSTPSQALCQMDTVESGLEGGISRRGEGVSDASDRSHPEDSESLKGHRPLEGGWGVEKLSEAEGLWPSVKERCAIARRHLQLSLQYKGEPRGIYEMRRHLSSYFKGLPEFKETRIRMVTTLEKDELYNILDEIEQRWG